MTAYARIVIYYFSGTGNSRNVAQWIAQSAKQNEIEAELIDIGQSQRRSVKPPPKDALLYFVSPIHGFNYPPIMVNFLGQFPRGTNRVVLMNTRAGMKIGKWVTPGLTGIAFILGALILAIKGYTVRGMLPIDLPSNWIFVHPGLNKPTVEYLHEKNRVKVKTFAAGIFTGKSDFRGLRSIVQDLIISPVAILYYCAGRFFLSKTYFASSDCDNCGICIDNCPAKAIIRVSQRPFWTFRCESCMRCLGNCPRKAIETAQGFAFGIWAVYYLLLSMVLLHIFARLFSTAMNSGIRHILQTLIALAIMGLGYRLMHYLLRYRWFERLMVYTSLTNYRFWGRRYTALKQ